MNPLRNILFTTLLCLPAITYADFYDGYKLKQLANSFERMESKQRPRPEDDFVNAVHYIGYIAGLSDALNGDYFCIPMESNVKQVGAIVAKYLRDNPSEWSEPAGLLVVIAIKTAFPCNK